MQASSATSAGSASSELACADRLFPERRQLILQPEFSPGEFEFQKPVCDQPSMNAGQACRFDFRHVRNPGYPAIKIGRTLAAFELQVPIMPQRGSPGRIPPQLLQARIRACGVYRPGAIGVRIPPGSLRATGTGGRTRANATNGTARTHSVMITPRSLKSAVSRDPEGSASRSCATRVARSKPRSPPGRGLNGCDQCVRTGRKTRRADAATLA